MMNSGVYLYTHWGGNFLKECLLEALKKKWRWDDEEYLTRIIFDVMTMGCHDEETGHGIGTNEHCDLNWPLLEVDVEKQRIKEKNKTWTFNEFIGAKKKKLSLKQRLKEGEITAAEYTKLKKEEK